MNKPTRRNVVPKPSGGWDNWYRNTSECDVFKLQIDLDLASDHRRPSLGKLCAAL